MEAEILEMKASLSIKLSRLHCNVLVGTVTCEEARGAWAGGSEHAAGAGGRKEAG